MGKKIRWAYGKLKKWNLDSDDIVRKTIRISIELVISRHHIQHPDWLRMKYYRVLEN